MITPIFKLSQDDDYLYVALNAPNVRLADAEIYYEASEFIFHSKPYYLRLELPGPVQTSERIDQDGQQLQDTSCKQVQYDFETKELVIPVPKLNKGEHFADLEMIGKFLSQPKSRASRRLVEVLDTNQNTPLIEDLKEEDDEDFDWNIEQKLPSQRSSAGLLGNEPYGFANGYSGVLERLGQELTFELVDISQPGKKSPPVRRQLRLQQEGENFDDDHYIADLYDTERIGQLIEASAPWDQWDSTKPESILTNEDRQRMIDRLPKREFVKYDATTKQALMLGVVDILFAYAYDLRTNDFEHTSESGWIVRKLSPTLSWFEFWTRIDRIDSDLSPQRDIAGYVLTSCVRRSLIYPLYRNWDLSLKVAKDVITLLSKGRTAILKCFLDLHQLLNESGDNYYLLNDLYISDYCCWLQKCVRHDQFDSLASHLDQSLKKLTKSDVSLYLLVTEQAAQIAYEEAQEQESLAKDLKESLQLNVRHSSENNLDSDDDAEP